MVVRNTSNWDVSGLQHVHLEPVDRIDLCSLGLAQCRGLTDVAPGVSVRAVNSSAGCLQALKLQTASLLPLLEPSSVKIDSLVPR